MSFFYNEELVYEAWELIQRAKKRLVVVSPWVDLEDEYRLKFLEAVTNKSLEFWLLTRPPSHGRDQTHDENIKEFLHIKKNRDLNPKLKGFIRKKWTSPFKLIFVPHLHAKMIWADDYELIVSSLNLIPTSLERNEEAGIATYTKGYTKESVNDFIQGLIKKYSEGPEYDLSVWKCIECGEDIYNRHYRTCWNCEKKKKDSKHACPKCGEWKNERFPTCYPCHMKEQSN